MLEFFASSPRGTEFALSQELEGLGATNVAVVPAGVQFSGDLQTGYRSLLWSRVASRIYLRMAEFQAGDGDQLYADLARVPWSDYCNATQSFAFDVHLAASPELRHPAYVAQRAKDAVVDHFRAATGMRPDVDTQQPDLRFHLFVGSRKISLSLDLSGCTLHRRGYRERGGEAPVRENVAAALLLRGRWPEIYREGGVLLDPMCGTGTFAIEAAGIALEIAPGLRSLPERLSGWLGHKSELWAACRHEAASQAKSPELVRGRIFAGDHDSRAVSIAQSCLQSAGLRDVIEIQCVEAQSWQAPRERGLFVCNPPWGIRLADVREAEQEIVKLGDMLRERFIGWRGVIFVGDGRLGRKLGIHAHKRQAVDNGGVECQALLLDIEEKMFASSKEGQRTPLEPAQEVVNRIRKNLKNLASWRKRENISCYRIYDCDIPQYAIAVDVYAGHAHVQEYAPPPDIPLDVSRKRFREAVAAVREALDMPPERVHLKQRRRQKGSEQYVRMAEVGHEFEVQEGEGIFLVNLDDYLDTGLFLDHRPVRRYIAQHSAGKSFLNLFCYTGAATVQAALGGASKTVSVDASATYLEWAQRNLVCNEQSMARHQLVRADCRQWMQRYRGQRFDLIFLDPPTFSNSKRTEETFDVQRDHVELIAEAMGILAADGLLIFSTNLRRFKLDPEIYEHCSVEDFTAKSYDPDFARDGKLHHCYFLRWPEK